MFLLSLNLGTHSGLTLIKLSGEAQTLDHEYCRGYGTALLLWQTPRKDRSTKCLLIFGFKKQPTELFNSALWLLGHLFVCCLTHDAAAHRQLSLDAVVQRSVSDRCRREPKSPTQSEEMRVWRALFVERASCVYLNNLFIPSEHTSLKLKLLQDLLCP